MKRVGFLLNHDATHQIMHIAPIAFELALRYPELDAIVLYTSAEERAAVERIAGWFPGARFHLRQVAPPLYARVLDRLSGRALPAKRLGVLWHHRDTFRQLDALVVPEKTSLKLRSLLRESCPRLINIRHGAGDRRTGNLDASMQQFDFHLLPGRKYERQAKAAGIVGRNDYAVVGYPKLDLCRRADPPALFDNKRPTIVYAPHFDPGLSSWYDWGAAILKQFAGHAQYNLIFAPHILLFRRRWHISPHSRRVRRTGRPPGAAFAAENIIIDLDSPALVDMTYLRAADIYLGDVSSQVYEFLYHPRPCVFLNPGRVRWRDKDTFRYWRCGPVVDQLEALEQTLSQAQANHANYRAEQQRAFEQAFELGDRPSATRAADAIAGFLQTQLQQAPPTRPAVSA